MNELIVGRYSEKYEVYSSLDRMEDLLNWLGYLKSTDYVVSILKERHNYSLNDAKKRAKKIVPHAKYALEYLDQASKGPVSVAFLPNYYAILNLAKIVILCGPYYSEYSNQTRHHGATYKVQGKDSRSILTEEVTLKTGGALALYYKTLTGRNIGTKKIIKMKDVYSSIYELGIEYQIASGTFGNVAHIDVNTFNRSGNVVLQAKVRPDGNLPGNFGTSWLPVLCGFKKINSKTYERTVASLSRSHIEEAFDTRYLIRCSHCGGDVTLLRNSKLRFTHEFPIALMFFHMGSVVRYKPEFLNYLETTKHWPLLMAGLRHGLHGIMLDVWCHVHNRQYVLKPC